MTLVADILARAARECSVTPPSSWITATTTTHVELRDDFLLETVDELQKRVDWASPLGKTTTITGDGSVNYALPSNFVRPTNDDLALYEGTNLRRACTPINSDGEWEYLNDIGSAGGARYYRLKGYEGNYTVDFYPTMTASDSVTVSYVSDVWMKTSGGTEGNAFTALDDVALYPRRILENGIVWRFRKRKGLPYSDVMAEYEAWIATTRNRMRGRGNINFGDKGTMRNPFDIPVPDFIPSS